MRTTLQRDDQSIAEHGYSVWRWLDGLLYEDEDSAYRSVMILPQWFKDHEAFIKGQIYSKYTIQDWMWYAIYHDCGKPYCIEYDDVGKRHFPNHAAISKKTWDEVFGLEDILVGSPKYPSVVNGRLVSELIGLDMICHTESWEQVKERNLDTPTLCLLLCSALAELHANASRWEYPGANMETFDGSTTAFKIKWKRLNSLGKKAMMHYASTNNS